MPVRSRLEGDDVFVRISQFTDQTTDGPRGDNDLGAVRACLGSSHRPAQ